MTGIIINFTGTLSGRARGIYVRVELVLQRDHRLPGRRHGDENPNEQIVLRQGVREGVAEFLRAGREGGARVRAENGVRRSRVQHQAAGTGPLPERRRDPTPRHHRDELRSRPGRHLPIRPNQQNRVERGRSRRARRHNPRPVRGSDRRLAQRRHEDHRSKRKRGDPLGRSRRSVGPQVRDTRPEQPVRDLRTRAGRHGRRRLERDSLN